MDLHPDFKELLASFTARNVEYIVVGGYALAFHGAPRMTGDLDLLVNPTQANAGRVLQALADFGFGSLNLTTDDLTKPEQVIQLGSPPFRVDLITSLSGVPWERALRGSLRVTYAGVNVRILGKTEFVENKRAVGRKRDLADLEAIGEE